MMKSLTLRRTTLIGFISISIGLAGLMLSGCTSSVPAATPVERPARPASSELPEVARQQVVRTYGELPLSFEVNQGQTDPSVQFLARGRGYTLFLTVAEAVLTLRQAEVDPARPAPTERTHETERPWPEVLRMQLVGANPNPAVSGLDELPGKSNYFIGNDPEKWHTDVPRYARVKYQDVYPGVDLVYYGDQRQLEYDLVVAPGADPEVITLAFQGIDDLDFDDQGNLILRIGSGEVIQHAPTVYQEVAGDRQSVDAEYVLKGGHQVRFQLGAHDAARALVIDPVLAYSTYLGGSNEDYGTGIAIDGAGNAYVTGSTTAIDFPTASPLQPAFGGPSDALFYAGDAFVTKLNATGSALVFSTYLGGSANDFGMGIAVDATGSAYVTGVTESTDFPTQNPLQPPRGGGGGRLFGGDAFVAKLSSTGSVLEYSTYLGGSNEDGGNNIAIDSTGNAFVTGWTFSTDFPTVSSLQPVSGGGEDAFVAKLNTTGSGLVYSTYLGGSGSDDGVGIAVDSEGSAHVTGGTTSIDFPTANPLQPASSDGRDGFVVKLDATGSAFVYSTYLGGSGNDGSTRITVDTSDNTYVTGFTASTDFPTANPLQPALVGGTCGIEPNTSPCPDAFVAKLNTTGSGLVYSTYLGGSSFDDGVGIAVDSEGNAYVTGFTGSPEFPTQDPFQPAPGGDFDAYVAKFNATGSALVYSTYFGGTDQDVAYGIAVDSEGNAYVTGYTLSTDFPTQNPFQSAFGGGTWPGGDAFVAKISGVPTTVVSYTSTNDLFPNPARGFFYAEETHSNSYTLLNENTLRGYRQNEHITLIKRYFYLKDFVSSPISQSYLDNMQIDFDTLRAAGLKAIVRFAYANQSLTPPYGDATKAQVLAHLDQLQPILQANIDVIAVVEAGFIGNWGEWFYTDHFVADPSNPGAITEADYANRREVLARILAVLPTSRMVQLRTPFYKYKIYETLAGSPLLPTPLSVTDAHNGSDIARTGHHNDCFLGSDTDAGTFGVWVPVADDKAYLADETKYVPMGGEVCDPMTIPSSTRFGCADTLAELERFHWSYLNKKTGNHSLEVYNGWDTGGCLPEIKQRLGYRLRLEQGTYADEVEPGGAFPIEIDLRNDGLAAPFNPRPAKLVLRHQATGDIYAATLPDDPRKWLPTDAATPRHSLDHTICTPADMRLGNYDMLLHLPDPEASLSGRPEYAIRLANKNIWEASTGYNDLGHTIEVTNAADSPACTSPLVVLLINTPDGDAVGVAPVDATTGTTPATVTFSDVTQAGNTSLTTSSTGPTPPSGFKLGDPPRYYDLTTTASFSGPVEVCMEYDDSGLTPEQENALELFHYENDAWANITATRDTDANVICGEVDSLSPFAIFQPENLPPLAETGGPYSADEGGSVPVSATGSDPDGDTLTFAWDLDNNGTFETPGQSVTFSAAGLDGPSTHTIAVRVTDSGDLSATDQATANVQNVAPAVGEITASVDPVQVNTEINASASFTDPGMPDTHTAVWDWGDGNTTSGVVSEVSGSGSVAGSHTYATPGVYTVALTVTDDDSGLDESVFQFVVINDPDGGFVTGSGWIDSSAGAYVVGPSLTGEAKFNFVARYRNDDDDDDDATHLTDDAGYIDDDDDEDNPPFLAGKTKFHFKPARLKFKSTGYDWLVIADARAQLKGSATDNDEGSYGFMLTVIDGDLAGGDGVDRFRIKIWDQTTGDLIYDNQLGAPDDTDPTTEVRGGNIVIHKK